MLIIDDCSTDNSLEIISSYSEKDNRIQLLSTDFCSGSPATPRNIGIQKARGQYIAFLDSDDTWLPEKLESQIKYFKDNQQAVFIYSNFEKITEAGTRNNRIVVSPDSFTYKKLLKGNCFQLVTVIYDATKIGKHYFPNIHHEDYALWLTILRKGNVAHNIKVVSALYRVRSNSVSSNKFVVIGWVWNIYRKVLELSLFYSVYYLQFFIVNGLMKYFK
jgi:glycosyltransferase involved in cell wall biosynthesis